MRATLELDGRRFDVELRRPEDAGSGSDAVDEEVPMQAVVGDSTYNVQIGRNGVGSVVTIGPRSFVVRLQDDHTVIVDGLAMPMRLLQLQGVAGAELQGGGGSGEVRPPMTGTVQNVLVEEGQVVEAGDVLFVLEAMKMHNDVKAPVAGVVQDVAVAPGQPVETGAVAVRIEPE